MTSGKQPKRGSGTAGGCTTRSQPQLWPRHGPLPHSASLPPTVLPPHSSLSLPTPCLAREGQGAIRHGRSPPPGGELPRSLTGVCFCFFKQKKESAKKTQDEEIKQIGEERTKQIYKSWKEDSEWQASCEYPEASGSRLAHTIKWPIWKALKEVIERSVF